jgi:hypothetical protein
MNCTDDKSNADVRPSVGETDSYATLLVHAKGTWSFGAMAILASGVVPPLETHMNSTPLRINPRAKAIASATSTPASKLLLRQFRDGAIFVTVS